VAQRRCLDPASIAQRNVDITAFDLDPTQSAGVSCIARNVACAFPMSDQPKVLGPVLLRVRSLGNRARTLGYSGSSEVLRPAAAMNPEA